MTNSEVKLDLHQERPWHIIALSAKTESGVDSLAGSYIKFLQENPDCSVQDAAYTANTQGEHSEYRAAVPFASREQLLSKLSNREYKVRKKPLEKPQIAFMFTGGGAQYPGMGKQVYECQPVFRQALEKCAKILEHEGVSLFKALQDPAIYQIVNIMPTLFAFEYALCELWKNWGIAPDYVIGHSTGEYVAATAAGILSLEDGLQLITTRGRLMQALPADGGMAAILTDEAAVKRTLAEQGISVDIAAYNGPKQIVLSGKKEEIDRAVEVFMERGLKKRRIYVSHASHSRLMEPLLDDFRQVIQKFTFHPPKIKFISNLTGKLVGPDDINVDYWLKHIRNSVQFAQGMEQIKEQGCEAFLEIGPSPILVEMGKECLPGEKYLWLTSMKRGLDDWPFLLESLGELYLKGFPVDWKAFDAPYSRKPVNLPGIVSS